MSGDHNHAAAETVYPQPDCGLRIVRWLTSESKRDPKRPAYPPAVSAHGVADGDLAAGNNLGIDAAIGMAEIDHQRAGNGQVADSDVGIDLGCRATLDAFDRFEPGFADRELAADEVELVPGRPAGDMEDCRESASGLIGCSAALSTAATEARLMMETTFFATSEKLWPSPNRTLGGPRNSLGHEAAEEGLDRQPPFFGAQVAARGFAAFPWIVSVWLASS